MKFVKIGTRYLNCDNINSVVVIQDGSNTGGKRRLRVDFQGHPPEYFDKEDEVSAVLSLVDPQHAQADNRRQDIRHA